MKTWTAGGKYIYLMPFFIPAEPSAAWRSLIRIHQDMYTRTSSSISYSSIEKQSAVPCAVKNMKSLSHCCHRRL